MKKADTKRQTWNVRRPFAVGLFALVFLLGAVSTWGVKTKITGAVVGSGRIDVSSNRQVIQHITGGIVTEILATNGDYVNAGDVVLQLDDMDLRSNLKIVEGELFETLAKEARLKAEIEERNELITGELLAEAAQLDPDIDNMVDAQRMQLAAGTSSLTQQSHLLEKKILQLRDEISGIESQLQAKTTERGLIEAEIARTVELTKSGLINNRSMYALEKEQVLNLGETGRLSARISELNSEITGLEIQLLDLPAQRKQEAVVELTKLQSIRIKLLETRNSIIQSLSQLEVRSPVSGFVHDSKVAGIRSVITPAVPLMYIVPKDRPTIGIVRIAATDIDQIFVGQNAAVKIKSFNRRTTPIVFGEVEVLSATAFVDKTTGKSYYEVQISLSNDELEKIGQRPLIPGMPVEAFIATEERSPFNYLIKPFKDYFDKAFRDS